MSLVTNTDAQVTVMTTKRCQLYSALLPKDAAAPTTADFKASAVTGNLGLGVRDEVKNTSATTRNRSIRLTYNQMLDIDIATTIYRNSCLDGTTTQVKIAASRHT